MKVKKEEVEEKKPKIKKEEVHEPILSADSVARRLAPFLKTEMDIDLDNPDLLVPVSRKFISDRYGGQHQNTFATPRKNKIELHGMKCFTFLMPEWNPNMPTQPGASGLAYCGLRARETMPLFVQKSPNMWLYCGHYQLHPSEPLTQQEWQEQDEIVRKTWIKNYFGKNWAKHIRFPKNKDMKVGCAYYRLRKNFRENGQPTRKPTPKETERCIALGHHLTVTHEELQEDIELGITPIPVDVVLCVEYDEDFQLELLRGYRASDDTWKDFPPELKERYAGIMRVRDEKARLKRELKEEEEEKRVKVKQEEEEISLKHPRSASDEGDRRKAKQPRTVLDCVEVISRRKASAPVHV